MVNIMMRIAAFVLNLEATPLPPGLFFGLVTLKGRGIPRRNILGN
jgi:hypothetical protein